MLISPEEKQASQYVLSIILEEESRNEQIKRENKAAVAAAVCQFFFKSLN